MLFPVGFGLAIDSTTANGCCNHAVVKARFQIETELPDRTGGASLNGVGFHCNGFWAIPVRAIHG